MTLIGEHCHRLLANSEFILDGLRMILFEGLDLQVEGVPERSADEKEALIQQLDELIVHMKDIMAILDYIISVMREDRSHSDEECDIYQKACNYLGYIWRLYGLSVTPKFHFLEAHAPKFLWKYRRFFDEDGIERLHASNNRHNRTLQCVKRFEDKIIIREKRKASDDLPGVQNADSQIQQKTSRKLGEESFKRKKAKQDARQQPMKDRRQNVKEGLIDGSFIII